MTLIGWPSRCSRSAAAPAWRCGSAGCPGRDRGCRAGRCGRRPHSSAGTATRTPGSRRGPGAARPARRSGTARRVSASPSPSVKTGGFAIAGGMDASLPPWSLSAWPCGQPAGGVATWARPVVPIQRKPRRYTAACLKLRPADLAVAGGVLVMGNTVGSEVPDGPARTNLTAETYNPWTSSTWSSTTWPTGTAPGRSASRRSRAHPPRSCCGARHPARRRGQPGGLAGRPGAPRRDPRPRCSTTS